jgi:predicted Abi (CAAX) family protease
LPLGGLLLPPAVRAQASPAASVGTPSQPLAASSETLASRSLWSRPESYPLAEKPRADLYRPSAAWIGRLILPTPQEAAAPEAPREDWVWIEIEQAPAAQRLGNPGGHVAGPLQGQGAHGLGLPALDVVARDLAMSDGVAEVGDHGAVPEGPDRQQGDLEVEVDATLDDDPRRFHPP